MRCTKALSMVKTCQLKPRRKFQPGRGALGPLPVTYSIDRGLQHQLPIYFAAIYRGYDSVEKLVGCLKSRNLGNSTPTAFVMKNLAPDALPSSVPGCFCTKSLQVGETKLLRRNGRHQTSCIFTTATCLRSSVF